MHAEAYTTILIWHHKTLRLWHVSILQSHAGDGRFAPALPPAAAAAVIVAASTVPFAFEAPRPCDANSSAESTQTSGSKPVGIQARADPTCSVRHTRYKES